MEIKTWKCDICGKIFQEGDSGFKNKEQVNLTVNHGVYDGAWSYDFKDVCANCRFEISLAIDERIDELRGK